VRTPAAAAPSHLNAETAVAPAQVETRFESILDQKGQVPTALGA